MKIERIYTLLEEDVVNQRLSRGTVNPSTAAKKTKKQTFYNLVKEASKKKNRKWVKLEELGDEQPLWKLNTLAKDYQKHNWKFRRLSFETINGKLHVAVLR